MGIGSAVRGGLRDCTASRLPMAKRILAGILGSVAVLGSLLPLGFAFEISKDFFNNPATNLWTNVAGGFLMSSIALYGFWLGARLLRFAASGVSRRTDGWMKPLLLGAGSFFPGFVFSVPICMMWIHRTWPHDDGKVDLAFEGSACAGAVTAIICTILLYRKRAHSSL